MSNKQKRMRGGGGAEGPPPGLIGLTSQFIYIYVPYSYHFRKGSMINLIVFDPILEHLILQRWLLVKMFVVYYVNCFVIYIYVQKFNKN